MRVCWETNGAAHETFLSRMAALSLSSGGLVKVDLKAWNEGVHYALCGVTNTQTLENFRRLAHWNERRPEPPFLIASTLLVPGYVDEEEVSAIARFIAGLNPEIPYSLLAFYPSFYLRDLPTTSRLHALRCREAAEAAGLHRVRIGNVHLLGEDY
jgi:pyruvate formate lyase activating enzyme